MLHTHTAHYYQQQLRHEEDSQNVVKLNGSRYSIVLYYVVTAESTGLNPEQLSWP